MKQNISIAEPDIGTAELQNVSEAVKSGWVSSKGPFIEKFENGFSKYVGTKFGVSSSNGTTALHLALEALEIGKNDKVLVPSLTFISVANAVRYTGATPVFIDSDPEYWCMDPSDLEAKIDKQTKAIIPVHLYGHPCEMDKILSVAKTHNLAVIEDCAEAPGAEYRNKQVGTFGCISCFSFYGNKIITTGEGGMCLTNDEDIAVKMKILRDHGMNPQRRYWHDVIGFNYRMTNLQAALGVAQLGKLTSLINEKRRIASTYTKLLSNLSSISCAPEMKWAKNVYWLYSIIVKKNIRDKLMAGLEKEGIETRPFFNPIPLMPPYQSYSVSTPVAEELSYSGINLPSGFHLTDQQIEDIVDTLAKLI